ncbi:class I SAM-dependent methyltransferase [Umezawaea beigongshangensis]|uniref:class I SAM-dependent methyltransferase n=1 Tax=Umezawaea beigongshangensis TaxID=2780383 RepID=UPI0018F21B40|nr:SAM-dependent methyltransferase [Umezawaea beigongshangensis]
MTTRTRAPRGVSRTAVLTAAARAAEHERPDRLFADPFAGELVEAAGGVADLSGVCGLAGEHFVLRTRFFDDVLLRATALGCAQVVLVAVGLDARAHRLPWPGGTTVFEVDLPELIDFKDAVLASAVPACHRVVVPADLRGRWPDALLAAGFDPRRSTAWLVEGVLMFLRPDEAAGLLDRIGLLSAPGSRLAVEHVNGAFRRLPQMREVHRQFSKLDAEWYSHVDDPDTWLTGHGWVPEVADESALAAASGRPAPGITDPRRVGDARIWLVDAQMSRSD